MAEYSVVIKEFNRMCAAEKCSTTVGCPMYPSGNISQCRKIAFTKPAEFESRVMQWASEHPETLNIAWGEWLESIGLALPLSSGENDVLAYLINKEKAREYIPPDIVHSLGIKPREGIEHERNR